MFKYLTQKWKQKRGFTLMEVMVVVAILAVIAGIAIPSVINMRKNMKFTERNDYAKSIFMAAQANLTEMRSKGELSLIIPGESDTKYPVVTQQGSTTSVPPATYSYTWNDHASIFDCVLPATSIDSAVRNGQIIIEYNPAAGIVYSVFYYDDDDMDLKAKYASGALTRDEEGRKDLLLGYYSVGNIDALDAQALDVIQIASSLSFTNAMEGTISIVLPTQHTGNGSPEQIVPDDASYDHYQTYLEVSLTITGENSGSFTTIVKPKGEKTNCSIMHSSGLEGTGGNMVHIDIPIDSLKNGSFNSLSGNLKDPANPASGPAIAPGDNVTITAEVTFYPDADDPIVMIESSTIAGINPLYHSLTQNPDTAEGVKPYILAISNARHLQNLRHLDGAFADANIESIVFVAQTEEDAVTNSGGSNPEDPSTPSSDPAEPSDGAEKARTAGTPNENEESESPSTPAENTKIAIDWDDAPVENFTPIKFDNFNNGHKLPKIIGNGVEILNLKIEKDIANVGLFASLINADIEGISLIDPIVENTFAALTTNATAYDSAATTGALIGTADGVTIKDCSVISSSDNSDDSYISGNQFVGGLVGYVKGTSSFENCAADIFVNNVSGTVQTTDKLPHILGGLVGYVEGTSDDVISFTGCTTTATVTATTATDLGGMAGKAVNASFTGCSTEATVTGADEVVSNIGGLVGEASNVAFADCNADISDNGETGATVTSGENTHPSEQNKLGGLVGLAFGSSTFNRCTASKGTTVTSESRSLSNAGGIVGYADSVTFTNCKGEEVIVTGVQPTDENGGRIETIPNSNLGGFVGYSLNCQYTNTEVTLKTRPEYAEDAGGFAGILKGGTVNDLVVNLELSSGNDVSSADTLTYFGGIASRCNGGASVTNARVTIKGTVNNVVSRIAGAFAVTGGDSSATLSYIRVNLSEATLASAQTAGLIVHNGSNSEVEKSYARGKVVGNSDNKDRAGFVFQNDGIIEQCFANVIMSQGNAFVTVNNGTIKNCYGWVWDNGSNVELEIEKRCSRSYFVNGETDEMILYEGLTTGADTSAGAVFSEKSKNILDTSALTDIWALDILNTGVTDSKNYAWQEGNADYPYPTLVNRAHIGDASTPATGNYPYYVLYTDKFGSILMSFDGYGKLTDVKAGTDKSDSPAYSLCCRTKKNLSNATVATQYGKDDFTDTAFVPFGMSSANRLYTIYTLTADKSFNDLNFNTYYPYYSKDGAFQIRNADQFKNIPQNDGKVFYIAANITISEPIDSFSGYLYDTSNDTSNDITITAVKSLVDELSGTLSGLTVTGLTAPMVGTIEGGTVIDCDVSGEIETGENVGIIAGTMSSGSIDKCNVSGSISGSGYVGGVVGEVTSGSVSDVNSSVTVNGSDATKSGMFVGYAEGGSFTDCKSTAANTTLPFGNFETRSLSGSATHYTTTPPTGLLYESHFNKYFSEIPEGSSPTTVDATLKDCTFMNGSESVNAIKDTTYYYNITGYGFESVAADSYTIGMSKTEKEYKDFVSYISQDPIVTDYFYGTGSGYTRLYVAVSVDTKITVPASTDSEGNKIDEETEDIYTFIFSDSKGSQLGKYEISEKKLDDTLPLSTYTFYSTLKYDSTFSGNYRIECGSGYASYDKSNFSWSGTSEPNTIWKYHEGYTFTSWNDSSISISFTVTTENSFTSPVKVTVNGAGDTAFTVEFDSFYVESGVIYRTYTGNVIEGHEIFYP